MAGNRCCSCRPTMQGSAPVVPSTCHQALPGVPPWARRSRGRAGVGLGRLLTGHNCPSPGRLGFASSPESDNETRFPTQPQVPPGGRVTAVWRRGEARSPCSASARRPSPSPTTRCPPTDVTDHAPSKGPPPDWSGDGGHGQQARQEEGREQQHDRQPPTHGQGEAGRGGQRARHPAGQITRRGDGRTGQSAADGKLHR